MLSKVNCILHVLFHNISVEMYSLVPTLWILMILKCVYKLMSHLTIF